MKKRDIETIEDVQKLVNTFYGYVQADDLLGPIFNGVIQDNWDVHLQKMYRFWQTILLDEHTYRGRPFPPHARLPIHQDHFERWLGLFHGTVDTLFEGDIAEEAKSRALKMATMFNHKIEYFRSQEYPIA